MAIIYTYQAGKAENYDPRSYILRCASGEAPKKIDFRYQTQLCINCTSSLTLTIDIMFHAREPGFLNKPPRSLRFGGAPSHADCRGLDVPSYEVG